MSEGPLESVKSDIAIEFESSSQAKIIYDSIILELKAVSQLTEAHELQLVNYLKATDIEVGLLLNFGPKPEFKRRFFSKESRELLKRKNPVHPLNQRLKNDEEYEE